MDMQKSAKIYIFIFQKNSNVLLAQTLKSALRETCDNTSHGFSLTYMQLYLHDTDICMCVSVLYTYMYTQ